VSRRALTLLLASVLAFGLLLAGGFQRVPYVALSPGPAVNTLGGSGADAVLSISGAPTYDATGSLDLTTVSVQSPLSLFQALAGWVSQRQAVVPREYVFPPDQTRQEQTKHDTEEMLQSQDDATTAALTELGIPALVTVSVADVAKGAPAAGKLNPGDVLTAVDGAKVKDAPSLRALISKHQPGDAVSIGYTRNGKAGTATITTRVSADAPRHAVIGIQTSQTASFPITVDIRLKDIGGPSAGLMFALGIIEKLGKDSLTGGRNIAGTGTISMDGKVGRIGGIVEKMLGAKDAGASVFLAPTGNCQEAKGNKPAGLTLVRVVTLKDALSSLATLRAGGTPPSC
jgi:PDZ domain-containing protein